VRSPVEFFLLLICLFLLGCGRPAAQLTDVGSTPKPTPEDLLPSGVTSSVSKELEAVPVPTVQPEQSALNVPMFSNPVATDNVNRYIAETEAIKNLPPPNVQGEDLIKNPSSIAGYLNNLGDHLKAMQSAREGVESNLSPVEKSRWRDFEKSLQSESQ
jgi:hypothetical protein